MLYNIYCDEVCHPDLNGDIIMSLGTIWSPRSSVKEINGHIKELKENHSVSKTMEMKWGKISPAKIDLYVDLINYFFDFGNLYFRGIVYKTHAHLNSSTNYGNHYTGFKKLYSELFNDIIESPDDFKIFLNITDTHPSQKEQEIRSACYFESSIHLQSIRSDEIQIMQIADIITGAICRKNRAFPDEFTESNAKRKVADLVDDRLSCSLRGDMVFYEK